LDHKTPHEAYNLHCLTNNNQKSARPEVDRHDYIITASALCTLTLRNETKQTLHAPTTKHHYFY